jgi:deoxyribodipyrimidine photo-lyase
MEADAALGASLQALGVGFHLFGGSLLREPAEMRAPSSGGAYMVFSPFWRKLRLLGADLTPLSGRQTAAFPAPKIWPASDDLEDWGLLPRKPNWAAEFPPHWTPGEAGARKTLSEFLGGAATGYAGSREIPALRGTSRLSPHLAFGEIAPAAVWRAVAEHARRNDIPENDAEKYLSELAWREFSQHLLHAFPNMATAPLRGEFRQFPYEDAPERFRAWARGETGFPIVDAGMRELWRTGWMHNRVRMIVASFLTKNLLIDWRRGEQWFAETLLDYDPANNIANWQWVAGCGADAAPYFRIFNPTTQGRKFDPEGEYVRRFVPELDLRSIKDVHEPVAMSSLALDPEGARRRNDYPAPIVDLAASRQRALAAFDQMKKPLAKGENRSHVTRHDKDAFS